MATVTYIKETRQHISAMRNVMLYCMRADKTWDEQSQRYLISGINCDGHNSILEFEATKAAHGKMDGINFYQYVQSFKPTEIITPKQAHEVALEFAARAWPGAEVLVTTHCDANHVHSHFIINSVNFETGMKLRQDPNTLKFLRMVSDDICMAHGFSVLPKYQGGGKKMSAREYRAARKGESWKFRLMYDVNLAMKVSGSKEEFIREMKRRGYEVKWTDDRKNITFTCPNKKPCRDNRLHNEKYLKENIEHELYTRQCILAGNVHRRAGEAEWAGHGGDRENTLRTQPLRSAGGMAESGQGSAPTGGRIPAHPVPDDPSAGNSTSDRADAGRAAPAVPGGEAGDASHHPEFHSTGWESEREVFFRNLRTPFQAPGRNEIGGFGNGQKAEETPPYRIGGIDGALGAGLRGLASAGRLIEDDSEEPDERRKRMEAQQAGSNVGTILGLAIGAAMALTEIKTTEEQVIQDEQDFNEFLAQMEAEEEEHFFQQSM